MIDFKSKFVGRAVVYRGAHPGAKAEQGLVTSVNADANIVFVSYGGNPTSAATTADDRLTFLNGEPVRLESNAGGRS
jgi:hypothetical protein